MRFSLNSQGQSKRKEIVQALIDSQQVAVVLETGGDFECAVAFIARRANDLILFLQVLSD